jgi:hypothetical protein
MTTSQKGAMNQTSLSDIIGLSTPWVEKTTQQWMSANHQRKKVT